MLIGKWNSKNYESISFNNDDTFIDTLFTSTPYSNVKVIVPLYVIKGKYSVKKV